VRYVLCLVASVLMLLLGLLVVGPVALVALAVAVTVARVFVSALGWATAAGVLAGGTLAAAGVALLSRRRRRQGGAGMGVSVTTQEQPLFWVEIYRVAEGLGARPPDEVLLFPDTTVAASGHRTWLGFRPGVRRLHLGLPVLTGLSERELRAVIALAFCRSWRRISLAGVIRRGQEIIGHAADRLGEGSKVARIVGRYDRAYRAVSLPVTRRQELATDALCADFAGNAAIAAAVREVAVLDQGWAAFVDGYVEPARAVGLRPHDVFASFACFLQEPGRRAQLAESAGAHVSRRPMSGHSQVSVGDRLAAIASLPDDAILDRSGPALSLMRYPDHVISRVQESLFPASSYALADWEEIVPEAARAAACDDALELARLAQEGGLGPALSVATLLELLGFGLADEMVRPMLARGASPDAVRQMARRRVTGFLATAAIESGTASYRFSWAAPAQLVDEQGAPDDLPLLVDTALANENDVSALELWLSAHGVAQDLELGPDDGQGGPPALGGGPAESQTEDVTGDPRSLAVRVSGAVSA